MPNLVLRQALHSQSERHGSCCQRQGRSGQQSYHSSASSQQRSGEQRGGAEGKELPCCPCDE